MGAEREDTDPNPKRGGTGTEPGLGKVSGPGAAAPEVTAVDEVPPPVDFDALHAALGDPLDYDELPSSPAIEAGAPTSDVDELFDEETPGKGARIGESSGRSSATYASARPHTIPPTLLPVEDLNAPPVIVAADDFATVPSAPPQMTVPLAATPHAHAYGGGMVPGGPPGTPGSGPHPAAAPGVAYSNTPQPFVAIQRGVPQMTMRMPDRPVTANPVTGNMRRGKTPTLVLRPRGPSTKQKLVAFMAMLVLVTACGIAVIIWRKPRLLGLDLGAPSPTTSASASPMSTPTPTTPAPTMVPTSAAPSSASGTSAGAGSGAASSSAATTAIAAAAAPPKPKPPKPVLTPASAMPTAHPSTAPLLPLRN